MNRQPHLGRSIQPQSADIFVLQGDLAKEMTTALRMHLSGEDEKRLAKNYTANPEAYQDYLQGRFWWNKQWGTEEGMNKCIEYFQQAIAKDPTYALAYSGLADSYALLGLYRPPKEAFSNAKQAALKALALDGQLSEAHATLGRIAFLYDWDWATAEKEVKQAIELNPNSSNAHESYGEYLAAVERVEEEVEEVKRALQLDPLSVEISAELTSAFNDARRYDEAIEQGRHTVALDPSVSFYQSDTRFRSAALGPALHRPAAAHEPATVVVGAHFGIPKRLISNQVDSITCRAAREEVFGTRGRLDDVEAEAV